MIFLRKKIIIIRVSLLLLLGIMVSCMILFIMKFSNAAFQSMYLTESGPVSKSTPRNDIKWGAFVGDHEGDMEKFEALVEKEMTYFVKFENWQNGFPVELSKSIGEKGKTLVLFWEPEFGYDRINNGGYDKYVKEFAAGAKSYGYPVILIPFPEMNLNEEAWGYGQNNNSADKFKSAWRRIHRLFEQTDNVKFGIAYNNFSIPEIEGNSFDDYYPGGEYVDFVGVDGFNFEDPKLSFGHVFDKAVSKLSVYEKPLFIFSMACAANDGKAEWILDGLGEKVQYYKNLVGWIWFNQGGEPDWRVDSDPSSLEAFKAVLP